MPARRIPFGKQSGLQSPAQCPSIAPKFERAKPFLQDFPGFIGGILENFKWVLERMGVGYSIVLNSGSEIGFDMEPETVAELAQRLTEEGRQNPRQLSVTPC